MYLRSILSIHLSCLRSSLKPPRICAKAPRSGEKHLAKVGRQPAPKTPPKRGKMALLGSPARTSAQYFAQAIRKPLKDKYTPRFHTAGVTGSNPVPPTTQREH